MSRARNGIAFEIRWWSRWIVCYFPGLLARRIRHCRHEHRGPMYDGWVCLTCGAPWTNQGRP